jgi:CheY-like chemotaxis protein
MERSQHPKSEKHAPATEVGDQVEGRHRTLRGADGVEGIQVFRAHGDAITAVLLDLTMPRMDGEETFREIRRIRPDACVILMSGFNEQEAAARFVGKGLAGFVQKPFSAEELSQRLATIGRAAGVS